MGVTVNERNHSPPVAVQEEATIEANLRYEGTVHHRSYRPQSLLDSTIHSCNQSVIIDATTLPTVSMNLTS
jgi:hypothetical protein